MPDIHHELVIAATAEEIYRALTDPKGLSAWWTPDTSAASETGSIIRFTFGQGYFKEMEITELKKFERVKWTCLKGAGEWIGTTISFFLTPGGKAILLQSNPEAEDQIHQLSNGREATLLTFHHDNWRSYTSMFAECNYTWGQFLRSLKLYCETGRGNPWPYQHHIKE